MLLRKIRSGIINSIVLNDDDERSVSILLLSISVLSTSTGHRSVVLSLYKHSNDEKIPNTLLFLVDLGISAKYLLLGGGTLEVPKTCTGSRSLGGLSYSKSRGCALPTGSLLSNTAY